MNHKWMVATLLAVALFLTAGIAFAAQTGPAPADSPSRATGDDRPPARDHIVQGEVVAATGDQATVETADGLSVTLRLGDDTHYWVPGSPPTGTLALAEGDPVLVFGRPVEAQESDGERALDARLVVVVEPDDVPRYVVAGRVVVVTAETVVVRAPRGERAITVLPATRLFSPTGRLDSLRDVRRGDQIVAVGQPTELGQWTAGLLLTAGGRIPARTVRGEVITVDLDAGRLEITTLRQDTLTVEVTERTRYRVPGVESPTLADLNPGDRVAIAGRIVSTDPPVLTAAAIGLLPAQAGD